MWGVPIAFSNIFSAFLKQIKHEKSHQAPYVGSWALVSE